MPTWKKAKCFFICFFIYQFFALRVNERFYPRYWNDYAACDQIVADDTQEYLPNMFDTTEKSYSFVYFANIDVVGHEHGWCSQEQYDAIALVDNQVSTNLLEL